MKHNASFLKTGEKLTRDQLTEYVLVTNFNEDYQRHYRALATKESWVQMIKNAQEKGLEDGKHYFLTHPALGGLVLVPKDQFTNLVKMTETMRKQLPNFFFQLYSKAGFPGFISKKVEQRTLKIALKVLECDLSNYEKEMEWKAEVIVPLEELIQIKNKSTNPKFQSKFQDLQERAKTFLKEMEKIPTVMYNKTSKELNVLAESYLP